ncbi:MAG: hypothetical protein ACXADX_19465, partial [Candidatus Hodarchaeales archaeon]
MQKTKLSYLSIRIILGTLFFSMFLQILVINVFPANASEEVGKYEIKMYLDGPFTGKTTITRESSSESISTYFGTYSDVMVTSYSKIKLEHSSKGYVEVKNWKSYSNEDEGVIKSESSWSFHLEGYESATFVMKFEYGEFRVIRNTETAYEESYTQRYYEDGTLEEVVSCRDNAALENENEKVSTDAGTFTCHRIKTTYFEDNDYSGYSITWITEDDAKLIQQESYDENNDLTMTMKLTDDNPFEMMLPFLIIFGIIAIGGVVAFYFWRKKKRTTPEYRSPRTASWRRPAESSVPLRNNWHPCIHCGFSLMRGDK